MLVELEEQGIPRIEERKGECGRWLHLSKEVTEGVTECLLSCYDIGGRQEYYNTQRVRNLISSFHILFKFLYKIDIKSPLGHSFIITKVMIKLYENYMKSV